MGLKIGSDQRQQRPLYAIINCSPRASGLGPGVSVPRVDIQSFVITKATRFFCKKIKKSFFTPWSNLYDNPKITNHAQKVLTLLQTIVVVVSY